jgi:hypothetical protein
MDNWTMTCVFVFDCKAFFWALKKKNWNKDDSRPNQRKKYNWKQWLPVSWICDIITQKSPMKTGKKDKCNAESKLHHLKGLSKVADFFLNLKWKLFSLISLKMEKKSFLLIFSAWILMPRPNSHVYRSAEKSGKELAELLNGWQNRSFALQQTLQQVLLLLFCDNRTRRLTIFILFLISLLTI